MTGPVPADSEVDMRLGGKDPSSNGYATWQATHARARNVWGTADQNAPFQTDFGQGPQPIAIASYDQLTCTTEVGAWRHVDPYGNVPNPMKLGMLLWYWLMDGCPTDMGPVGSPANRIPAYVGYAKQLRDWPSTYAGAMPGEPKATYPTFPPSAPTGLDSVAAQNVSVEAPSDPRTHPPVTKVRFSHGDEIQGHGWNPIDPNPVAGQKHSRYLPEFALPHVEHVHAAVEPHPAQLRAMRQAEFSALPDFQGIRLDNMTVEDFLSAREALTAQARAAAERGRNEAVPGGIVSEIGQTLKRLESRLDTIESVIGLR